MNVILNPLYEKYQVDKNQIVKKIIIFGNILVLIINRYLIQKRQMFLSHLWNGAAT